MKVTDSEVALNDRDLGRVAEIVLRDPQLLERCAAAAKSGPWCHGCSFRVSSSTAMYVLSESKA